MRADDINRLCKICLDIASYYDNKGDNDKGFYKDELTDEIGLGYRALTGYLRQGVKAIIDLQDNYHTACEQRNYEKSIQESQKDFLLDMFSDEELYDINDKDKQRIKEFVQSIFKEWEQENEE